MITHSGRKCCLTMASPKHVNTCRVPWHVGCSATCFVVSCCRQRDICWRRLLTSVDCCKAVHVLICRSTIYSYENIATNGWYLVPCTHVAFNRRTSCTRAKPSTFVLTTIVIVWKRKKHLWGNFASREESALVGTAKVTTERRYLQSDVSNVGVLLLRS